MKKITRLTSAPYWRIPSRPPKWRALKRRIKTAGLLRDRSFSGKGPRAGKISGTWREKSPGAGKVKSYRDAASLIKDPQKIKWASINANKK
jgi:hypothetical protein